MNYQDRRTITTINERDALPEYSIILDQHQVLIRSDFTEGGPLEWADIYGNEADPHLPATVLYRHGETLAPDGNLPMSATSKPCWCMA